MYTIYIYILFSKKWFLKEKSKILILEDFGHVLGNGSRFSSTHKILLLTARKKKTSLNKSLQIHAKSGKTISNPVAYFLVTV